MADITDLRTRAAALADAAAIAAIYNEGIADRIATFETEPRLGRTNCRVVQRAAACDCCRNRGEGARRVRRFLSL